MCRIPLTYIFLSPTSSSHLHLLRSSHLYVLRSSHYICASHGHILRSPLVLSVVSPANHFLFTSFLPSTAVGTLEFRAIQEPIRTVKGLKYYQAKAIRIEVSPGPPLVRY